MKKMLMVLALLFALVGSSFGENGDGYYHIDTKITRTFIDDNGIVHCWINKKNEWFHIGSINDPVAKAMYATALSAKNSNSYVEIHWDENDTYGESKYCKVKFIVTK